MARFMALSWPESKEHKKAVHDLCTQLDVLAFFRLTLPFQVAQFSVALTNRGREKISLLFVIHGRNYNIVHTSRVINGK